MNFRKSLFIMLAALTIGSCTSSPEDKIAFIEGYWEIKEVKKDGKKLKDYSFSSTIDYFEVRDSFSGFRKKVSPAINGVYLVSKHSSPFTLKIENDSLNIYYNLNDVITKETIIKATKDELVIVNSQGLSYIYKPYKSINIEE